MEIVASKGLLPTTLDEAWRLSTILADSGIVPKDFKGKPNDVFVALNWGIEIGLAPMQSLQSIAVINGRPSVWGDAALALVRGSGSLEYITETQTDTAATCKIKRKGEPEVTATFTVQDAQKANLWGKTGPWTQYPKRMMQMRARSFALRDLFTDVLKGVGIAEEEKDKPIDTEEIPHNTTTGEVLTAPVDPLATEAKAEPEPETIEVEAEEPQPGITVADINALYKKAPSELKPKIVEKLPEGWREADAMQLAEYFNTIEAFIMDNIEP